MKNDRFVSFRRPASMFPSFLVFVRFLKRKIMTINFASGWADRVDDLPPTVKIKSSISCRCLLLCNFCFKECQWKIIAKFWHLHRKKETESRDHLKDNRDRNHYSWAHFSKVPRLFLRLQPCSRPYLVKLNLRSSSRDWEMSF